MAKNLSMNVSVLRKILLMFDNDSELKINKIMKYNENSYHWTFNGIVNGKSQMMKLDYDGKEYKLKRTKLEEVVEVIKP